MEKSINPLLMLQLLALNDIEITEIKMNSANEIIIRVRSTKNMPFCWFTSPLVTASFTLGQNHAQKPASPFRQNVKCTFL